MPVSFHCLSFHDILLDLPPSFLTLLQSSILHLSLKCFSYLWSPLYPPPTLASLLLSWLFPSFFFACLLLTELALNLREVTLSYGAVCGMLRRCFVVKSFCTQQCMQHTHDKTNKQMIPCSPRSPPITSPPNVQKPSVSYPPTTTTTAWPFLLKKE